MNDIQPFTVQSCIVSCDACGAERQVQLAKGPLGAQIDWMEDGKDHQIVSFRSRLDGQYGWQCLCSNNSLMTQQERDSIENPSTPKPKEIADIVKNLKTEPTRFKVELATIHSPWEGAHPR